MRAGDSKAWIVHALPDGAGEGLQGACLLLYVADIARDGSLRVSLVLALQGVEFHWKDPEKDTRYGLQRGFVAQDVEKVIPEWVKTREDGYKELEKVGVEAILVEAIKAQNSRIDSQQQELSALESVICSKHPGAEVCKDL